MRGRWALCSWWHAAALKAPPARAGKASADQRRSKCMAPTAASAPVAGRQGTVVGFNAVSLDLWLAAGGGATRRHPLHFHPTSTAPRLREMCKGRIG